MTLNSRQTVGRSDLAVSPICLGTNVFGWTADEPTSFAVLDAFLDAGGNFIDTANVYSAWVPGLSGGDSETVIGRWLAKRGRRDDVVIATKVGKAGKPGGPFERGLSRDLIRTEIEESLRRLQTDYVDLYYSHEDDPDTPLDETAAAFDELVREGKVRVLGASNFSADRLQAALDVSAAEGLARYEILQPLYSLVERGFEEDLSRTCIANDLSVAPYYALARGFLTGKYRPGQALPESPRSVGISDLYMNDRGWSVLRAVDVVAAAHGTSDGAVALAWLCAKPAVVAPIASATSVEQVVGLADAAALALTDDEVGILDAAAS